MNLLLVDDQKAVLDDLRTRISWKEVGVSKLFMASSVAEAKSIAMENDINILMTDIEMPVESGIDLADWFQKVFPQVPFIFLTAHADFAYAQNAIKKGSFDYILQPAKKEEIEDVVEKCIRHLEKEKNIKSLIEKGEDYDKAQEKILKGMIKELFDNYNKAEVIYGEWENEINKLNKFQWYLPVLINTEYECLEMIENIIKENCKDEDYYFVVKGKSNCELYTYELIICGVNTEWTKEKICGFFEVILQKIENVTKQKIIIYVGKTATYQLLDRIEELKKQQKNNVYLKSGINWVNNTRTFLKLREPNKEEWQKWMLNGDGKLIHNQIQNLLDYAEKENQLSVSYTKQLLEMFEDVWVVCSYLKKINGKQWFSDEYTYESFSNSYLTVNDFMAGIDFVVNHFNLDLNKNSEMFKESTVAERINSVKLYIEENIDKNITRSDIAAIAYLSEDYFSKLFKNETGIGFKEYVIAQKMDYCKKLLSETNYPVSVIAGKVGYDNFSNFTQMFKKHVGSTPQEFRETVIERK